MADNKTEKEVVIKITTDGSAAAAGISDVQTGLDGLANTELDKPFKSMKAQLIEAKNEALKMSQVFGPFSEQAIDATKKLAELKDEFQEFNARVDSFNPDNQFQALVGVAKGATAAVQGVTAGMALLGVESENSVEVIKKLEALQSLSGMLNNVDDLKNGFKNLQSVFKSSFATLKAGIISTGIGLLVIIVGLLIANFDKVKEVVLNLIPGLAGIGKWVGKLVDGFTDLIGVTSEAGRAQQKFLKDTSDNMRKQQDLLDSQGDKYDKYTQAKMKANIDYAKKVGELDKDKTRTDAEKEKLLKSFREKANRDIAKADTDRNDEVAKNQKTADDNAKKKRDEQIAKNKTAAAAAHTNTVEYTNKLQKIEQETELFNIKEGYEKEKKLLENKIADDTRINLLAYQDKKITKEQFNTIQAALDIQAAAQRIDLTDKHNKEVQEKEVAFEKELNSIISKTKQDAITDARVIEKEQLVITYNEALAAAVDKYKDNQIQFKAIKIALDDQLRADQAKLDKKNAAEDAKKKFDLAEQGKNDIINSPDAYLKAKKDALDAEQVLVQDAFDNKVISEIEYNAKIKALSDKRKSFGNTEKEWGELNLNEKLDRSEQELNKLSENLGKQTVAGKAAAVAAATIATFQSATNSYNSLSSIPIVGPVLGGIAAAAAVVSGIANVKKILAVKVAGDTTSASAPTASAVGTAPVINSTATQQQTTQDVRVTNSNQDTVVRAYITNKDLETNEQKVNFQNLHSTF